MTGPATGPPTGPVTDPGIGAAIGPGAGPANDTVRLTGLRARGRHGCLPAERELGQEFVVDVTLHLDTVPAAVSDDLAKTVDYGELAVRLTRIVEGDPVNLIETLAHRLAAACLADELVEEVVVAVHKPAAPVPVPFDDVVVTVRRRRR